MSTCLPPHILLVTTNCCSGDRDRKTTPSQQHSSAADDGHLIDGFAVDCYMISHRASPQWQERRTVQFTVYYTYLSLIPSNQQNALRWTKNSGGRRLTTIMKSSCSVSDFVNRIFMVTINRSSLLNGNQLITFDAFYTATSMIANNNKCSSASSSTSPGPVSTVTIMSQEDII